jgi:hypothetical protein
MPHKKRSLLLSTLMAFGSLLLAGLVIIGVTVWIVLYANEPVPDTDTNVPIPKQMPPGYPGKWQPH